MDLGKHTSVWMDTAPAKERARLHMDLRVDAAVVGGGIAGLTTAYLLAREGKSVVLLEADRIVSGVTGFTTAKLTSNHGQVFKHLLDKFGEDTGRLYVQANEFARKHVVSVCSQKRLESDLQEMPSYTYAASPEDTDSLKEDADAAAKLGADCVSFTDAVPLPFETFGAMKFEEQHVFHPRKYLLTVAEDFERLGGQIFENTRVMDLDETDEGVTISTDTVTMYATDVVIATNYPIYDPMLYFARLGHLYSYVLGVKMAISCPKGMFYSTGSSGHSIRPHRWATDDEIVLIGGEEHPVGQGGDTAKRYRDLEYWARARFNITSVEYHWATHDAQPHDKVPMVGKVSPGSNHIYVATGFRGWGMTNATAAAFMISDEIMGRNNPWSRLFNPNRSESFFNTEGVKSNMHVAKEFIEGKGKDRPDGSDGLLPGETGVFDVDGDKQAIYRDERGEVHRVSAACSHMGCIVEWNNAEKTWDCPCHGSRFCPDGKVLHAPATKPLEMR